ncbi:hypothetical protein NP493_1127g00026 [Ridgeia piscesae]|uniref:F-box domain-containing protein n=1 Tax=Ridgeia piscesae TaxID=27915 RepID=A0AAD9NJR7_RIDPI|nr:hypothetical protein NP493_1127g00026 [Ridgeia piscesae]
MAEDKQQVTKTDRSRRRHSHRNRRRRTKNKPASALCLCWLPDDVLYRILSFCNLRDLGRLAQTCQRFACLVGADWTWIRISRRLTMVRDYTKRSKNFNKSSEATLRDQCHRALNWRTGAATVTHLVRYNVRQLPWLQLDEDNLWVSYLNTIQCFPRKDDGSVSREDQAKVLRGHRVDVRRFVSKGGLVVSGACDGSISCFNTASGTCIGRLLQCHTSDIHAVDFHRDSVIVSGSRDTTIKLWRLPDTDHMDVLLHTEPAGDRVWSVAVSPDGRCFVAGTAGLHGVCPLRLWDTHTATLTGALGRHYKYGAGVLDVQFESPDIVLSCGYDTCVRMWDLRQSYNQCVLLWEEPFDSTLYCVKSDGHNAIVTGTARHGMVRVWDKRCTESVQMYYVGRWSSPVYSLAYDTSHLYTALDRSVELLDFGVPPSVQR